MTAPTKYVAYEAGTKCSVPECEVSITAKPFFERAGYRVVRAQDVERQGIRLLNFFMERNIAAESIIMQPDAAR